MIYPWLMVFYVVLGSRLASSENSTSFLENIISKIQDARLEDHLHNGYRVTEEMDDAGTMELSQEQFAALYNAVLAQQSGVNMTQVPLHSVISTNDVEVHADKVPGYYYYYFPIKHLTKDQIHGDEALMAEEGGKPPKPVEPLFVAMASFVSVAMVFVFSILFLPKFGTLKSREMVFKKGSDELATFVKLVSQTFEGKDCTRRIVCEVGQAIRSMRLGTKPIRIIELLLPDRLAKQLATVRTAVIKSEKCRLIKCKNKVPDSND